MNFNVILLTLIIILILSVTYTGSEEVVKQNVSVAVTGDVMFCRSVPDAMEGESPFRGVSNITSTVDLLLINFENTASDSKNQIKRDVPLKCSPEYVPFAKANNRTIAALANNHIMDYGFEGMNDTITNLKSSNITPIGAGLNESEAHRCVVENISGRKITILNYMDSENFKEYSYDTMPYANGTHPGYSAYDFKDAERQINENNDSDLIIVFMHFGNEYSRHANSRQIEIAHDLIDSGADIVVGCHPHVTQNVEVYKGKPIFYSLGNFIFDQSRADTHQAYFIKLDLINNTCQCSLYPVYIKNTLPEFMDENSADNLLKGLSDEISIFQGVGKLQFNLTGEV